MSGTTIPAPWTAGQLASLEAFQVSEHLAPYVCGSEDCPSRGYTARPEDALPLAAGRDGLHCIEAGTCGYTQDWAHASAVDWSWQRQELRVKAKAASEARKTARQVRRDMAALSGGFTRRDWVRLAVAVILTAAILVVAHSPAGHWRFP